MSVLKYNICLCYHGFVTNPSTDATFRSYVNDFESTIQLLLNAGYTFIFPSQMGDWYLGKTTIPLPAACVIMDDGLDTVPDVTSWLITNKIPFGFAVIARRNRLVVPEPGYMTWTQINGLVASGYGEMLYHTYNMHHMCMTVNSDNQIEANPILDAPCWIDSPADFLYIQPGDTRWYWDYTFVDTCTWGFPLFGTDVYTNDLVTSTITFKAQQTLTVSIIRVWACLHLPPSSGYACQVEITVNGQVVFNNTIAPYAYETRSQWLERQFASITMDTPFNVVAGQSYTMVWTSKTNGPDLFRMYALPDFSGNYTMTTTCQGAPGTEDFPPGVTWSARPVMILASGQGSVATDAQYSTYVQADFQNFQTAINNYFNATWINHCDPYNENDPLDCLALGGTYEDGSLVDTMIRFSPDTPFTGETLNFKYVSSVGTPYTLLMNIYIGVRTGPGEMGTPTLLSQWQCTWDDWHWVEIDITPFNFVAGTDYYIHFQTLNQSPTGLGIMRVYIDQPAAPSPIWTGGASGGWTANGSYSFNDWYSTSCSGVAREYNAAPLTTAHTDVYPSGFWVDSSDNWQWDWEVNMPNNRMGGPGVPLLYFQSRTSTPVTFPRSIAYPFGAYFDTDSDTALEVPSTRDEVSPTLTTVMSQFGINYGFTIFPTRFVEAATYREPDMMVSQYMLPRLIIYGNIGQSIVENGVNALTNMLWSQDVTHQGLKWLSYEEQSATADATISLAQGFSFVGFDAYYFQAGGTIDTNEANVTFRDKATLQAQGVKALILFNNYNPDPKIDDFDPKIATDVFANPATYIPIIVNTMTSQGWDGVVIDIENVPDNCKSNANEFYRQLAQAMVPLKKLIVTALPALTGTSYDASGWALWCDYANILPYVDYAHIMTYTESGNGMAPAPHAPDWFFDVVYNYIAKVVNSKYWSRILTGANTYGNEWYWGSTQTDHSDPSTMQCDYSSFHACLSDGLLYGCEINFQDGECTWTIPASGRTAYFGDQNTVMRAVNMALSKGFGGVGIWECDMGDARTMFPKIGSPRRYKVGWTVQKK